VLGAAAALVLGVVIGVFVALSKRRRAQEAGLPAAALTATLPATPAAALGGAAAAPAVEVTEAPEVTAPPAEEPFDANATIEAEAAELEPRTIVTMAPRVEPEEDPLEEVNVYLAYERFDQAEELVKRVIQQYPERHDYKLRLLEVYYSSNNLAAYEAAARELRDAVGEEDALWGSAVAMWREMSPERELFAAGAAPEVTPAAAASAFVDITADTGAVGDVTLSHLPGGEAGEAGLDFDLSQGEAERVDAAGAGAAADETFDITGGETASDRTQLLELGGGDEVFDITGEEARAAADELLDITGGSETFDVTGAGGAEAPAEAAELLEITGGGATFDIADVATESEAAERLESTTPTGATGAFDLLDVTSGGDLTSVDERDVLNVTAVGPQAGAAAEETEETGLELAALADTSDVQPLDFDIGIAETAATEEARVAEAFDFGDTGVDDDLLDFDIGGLDEPAASAAGGQGGALETDTVELAPAVGAEAEEPDVDFDLTLDAEALPGTLNVVESEDDSGRVEITMSSTAPEVIDGELSLQGGELDELALDATGSADDFDLALDGTMDMYSVAAEDTLDMAAARPVPPEREGAEEFNVDTVEIEAYPADELDIEAQQETVVLEGAQAQPGGAGDTAVMPAAGEFELALDADDADTKLNLAKAYIELGDTEGARAILDEVRTDGTPAQQTEAESLLGQLER